MNIVYYLYVFGCDTLINSHALQTITDLFQQFTSKFPENFSEWCIYALWRHLDSAFQTYQMPGDTRVYLRPWGDMYAAEEYLRWCNCACQSFGTLLVHFVF